MKKQFWVLIVVAFVLLMIPMIVNIHEIATEDIPAAAPLPSSSPRPTMELAPEPKITTLHFSATGDNLIHDGIYKQAARRAEANGKSGYDFTYCFDEIREFYSQFDINWLNQETLVNNELAPSTYPCFSTPGEMGQAAYDLGFRVFNLSNNHSYDKGSSGISATQKFWSSMPKDVLVCGFYDTQNPQIDVQQKDGVSIAYLSYTEHTNGIPHPQNAPAQVIYTNQIDVIQKQIQEARTMADLVIVSTHWGIEGSHDVTQAQRQLAQNMANWGADVIIGTGPHMVQDAEWLKSENGHDCFVAYSLGNFLNAQSQADCMIGAVLTFDITKIKQPSGESVTTIETPRLHPIINHYDNDYANIRVYLFEDYTDELANGHGIRQNYPNFSRSYIETVLRNSIDNTFLEF